MSFFMSGAAVLGHHGSAASGAVASPAVLDWPFWAWVLVGVLAAACMHVGFRFVRGLVRG